MPDRVDRDVYQASIAKYMTERDLMQNVIDLAQTCGWMTYHTYDSRRSEAGFPDLILVRGDRLLAVECKRQAAKPAPAQRTWLDALRLVKRADACLWKPLDWLDGTIEQELR